MIRKLLSGSFLLLAVSAQSQEFGIELNGGLQGLQYKASGADIKLQPGGSLGFNYHFPFSKRWGLLTGITAGYYQSKATIDNGAVFSSYEVDDMGSAFQYNAKPTDYEEKQQFFAAGIPVMLQYQSCGKIQWYINGGTKILFPFNSKTKGSASQLAVSGYYPDVNVEIDDLPNHGFGTISNWENKAEQDLKLTATLSAATGFSFPVGEGLRLYTGLYFDYGLTDMRKNTSGNASFVTYSPTGLAGVQANGLLARSDKARLMAYGIQVRLGISKKKKKVIEKVELVEIVQEEEKAPPPPPPPPPPVKEKEVVEEVKVKEPEPAPVAIPDITAEKKELVERPVSFVVLGKTTVPEALKPHLDSVAQVLKQYSNTRVHIVGHTCDIGSEKENDKVGTERAKAVAAYLISKGVDEGRIETSSAGQSQPVVPNNSTRHRSENRRVTITVL